jgi:hypothetical protein
MHKFYFNDCLPKCESQYDFIQHFSKTLIEFNTLKEEGHLGIEKAIITDRLPSEIFLGNAYSLQDTIENIRDSNLKRLAFSLFNKYPIDRYFNVSEAIIEKIWSHNFGLTIDQQDYDALNIAIVGENRGFLFTVPIHNDLKQHTLSLKPKEAGDALLIHNLYGHEDNTLVIKNKIEALNAESLSIFGKLQFTLKQCIYAAHFERDFSKLSLLEQQSIIDEFEKAKGRGLITPFFPDTKIIKDVTPNNPKCKVLELRVYAPTALRVYFNETVDNVFLSSICLKSNPDQSSDIKKAHGILHKLILTV